MDMFICESLFNVATLIQINTSISLNILKFTLCTYHDKLIQIVTSKVQNKYKIVYIKIKYKLLYIPSSSE